MTRHLPAIALIALASAASCASHATTRLTAQKIRLSGNTDVDATAINAHGAITATVFDTQANTQIGIILDHGQVTILPVPYAGSAAPMPQAINARGDVLGYAYEGIQPHMFLYHAGQFDPNADVPLVFEPQQGPPPLPIGLNRHDAVFYTIITGQQNPTDPIYGKLPHVHTMPALMRYQTAHSLNANGVLAGTTFYGNASEVFVGHGKNFAELLPPGAVGSAGGFVNDAGVVAGIYTDSGNSQHGFTWANGTYTSFDLPEAAEPYSAAVTGINNAGRVVGTYASQASGKRRAFLYNGQTVTAFGNYGGSDSVSVSVNDRGTMVLSRNIAQKVARYMSYVFKCRGDGC